MLRTLARRGASVLVAAALLGGGLVLGGGTASAEGSVGSIEAAVGSIEAGSFDAAAGSIGPDPGPGGDPETQVQGSTESFFEEWDPNGCFPAACTPVIVLLANMHNASVESLSASG